MKIKIINLPVAREKKQPEIAISDSIILNTIKPAQTAVINKKDLFNGRQIEKSDLLMTAENSPAIYAERYYIDSEGNLVKISKFADGGSLIEIEPCEETIKYDELLCETIETNDEKISTGITRQRVKLQGNEIDICQMTLGTYRNYIEDVAVFDNLNVKQKRIPIPKLDSNGNIIPKSFTYESRIMCPPANKEQVIKLIKELKKTIIEWF